MNVSHQCEARRSASVSALWLEGARDMTPMVAGLIPFAVAIGTTISTSHLSRLDGLLSGPVILAGSAQLVVVKMLDAGSAPLLIILSAMMINARVLLYSASLAPWFTGRSLRSRLLLAIPVIDQLHFICTPRFGRGDLDLRGRSVYYSGAAVWLVGAWVGAQAIPIVIGATAPDALHLEIAAPLALVGLLAKTTDRRSMAAAVTGLVVAATAVRLPMHTSILAATLAGIAAGVGIGTRPEGRTSSTAGRS
jgi:predicted branched-subunit amino acid permease